MKKYNLKAYGRNIPVSLSRHQYCYDNNKSLAISMTSYEDGNIEPFAMLTVNIVPESQKLPKDCAFINTKLKGCADIKNWLINNGLGKPFLQSTRGDYEAFRFDLSKIN